MIELSVLGSLGLRDVEGRDVPSVLVRPKQLALLAYLAAADPRVWHQRNQLLALFWPESDDKRARFSLRSALYALRKDLGGDVVSARGDEELAVNRDLLWCDATAFEEHAAAGRFAEAMALYKGTLLDGVVIPGLSEFHLWLDRRRDTLCRTAVAATSSLYAAAESRAPAEALGWARKLEELAPYDESAVSKQLLSLQRLGKFAEAGQTFDRWAARIQSDLDAEPSGDLVALATRIRRGGAPATASVDAIAPATMPATMPAIVPATVPASRGRLRRRSLWAAGALGLIAIGALGIAAARRGGDKSYSRGTVVLPFDYVGDKQSAYLGSAFSLLMSASLGTGGAFGSVDPHAVSGAIGARTPGAGDLPLGREVGTKLGARYFIAGTVVTERRAMRVEAALYEVGGRREPVARAVSEGAVDSLFAVADRVASDLLSTRIGSVPSEALGTTSVVALRAYVDGERALLAADYVGAAKAFQRAVAADSLFARGYFRLGYADGWGAIGGDSAVIATKRALALSSRLTPSDRLLVAAWDAFLTGHLATANDLYEHLVISEPRSVEAWLQLAELRYHWGAMLGIEAPTSAQAFHRALALAPDQASALVHLARYEAREVPGSPALDSLARAALAVGVEPGEALELRALTAVHHADTTAKNEVVAAAAHNPGALAQIVRLLLVIPGDHTLLDAAARALSRTGDRGMQIYARMQMVHGAAARGGFREALANVDSLRTLNPARSLELAAWLALVPFRVVGIAELSSLRSELARADSIDGGRTVIDVAAPAIYTPRLDYLRGALAVLAGDTSSAQRAAAALRARRWPTQLDDSNATAYARELDTERLLRSGRMAEALASLPSNAVEPGNTFPDVMSFVNARERYVRAQVLAAAGKKADALHWLNGFPDPSSYDAWFLGGALVTRAQLAAASGDAATAERDYRRFLALWATSDAEMQPVVVGARAALAKLETR